MSSADIVSGILTRKAITANEVAALRKTIFADGVLHGNEAESLTFIKNNSPKIHASLEPLFKEAGL